MHGFRIGGPHDFGCDCWQCRDNWRRSQRATDLLIMKLNSREIYPVQDDTRVFVTARGVKVERLKWVKDA